MIEKTDFNFEEELAKLPKKPGVYLMHDKNDTIIYVGKAVILRNRVRSYFRQSTKKTVKIQQMVKQIAWFEYIVTDSEMEALVLENNLIKENQPKYNTMLKDDKTYPFIKVTINEDFPRLFMTRKVLKDGAKYYGPFTSSESVKETIELLRKLYKIRNCKTRLISEDAEKASKCLYYHIGQCDAPCEGKISKEEYSENVKKVLSFLNGDVKPLIKELEEKMQTFSDNLEFEKALEQRDLIACVKNVSQKQKITDNGGVNRDIIGIAQEDNSVIIQMFFVREGKMVGKEHYYMKNVDDEPLEEILETYISQFYFGAPFVPKEIVLPVNPTNCELLEEYLTKQNESKVTFIVPQKGTKEKLLELACENARIKLGQDLEKIKRNIEKTVGAVGEIAELLDLTDIHRMEAYDISNISGFESVGSMVVFEDGKSKPNEYRKFKIKSVEGPNDYASMKEVLFRRFSHGLEEKEKKALSPEADDFSGKFDKFPDLILMDGGKGQVNICEEVLSELNLSIPVCGMVKDDNHRTRGLYYNNVELPISHSSEGFKLITRIQDEAHRFAITFHKNLRSKKQVHSVLDDIPGVGPVRRKALMKHFDSLDAIKNASVEELSNIPELDASSAKAIFSYFH